MARVVMAVRFMAERLLSRPLLLAGFRLEADRAAFRADGTARSHPPLTPAEEREDP